MAEARESGPAPGACRTALAAAVDADAGATAIATGPAATATTAAE